MLTVETYYGQSSATVDRKWPASTRVLYESNVCSKLDSGGTLATYVIVRASSLKN